MADLLNGMRVVDLGHWIAGPYCAKLLADAGADVIHVERPGTGDPLRAAGPFAPADAQRDCGATFAYLNAGKRSVTLDFATPEGRDLLGELATWADVLVENFAPGTLARHGAGFDRLATRNPRLVQISISNYGQTGPLRDMPATELTLQAAAGLMDGNGAEDREPLRYPLHLAQIWAGANAAYAGMAAWWHAQRTGEGQTVDVSIQESIAATYFLLYADYEYVGALQQRGQRDVYRTADGWVGQSWSTATWEEYAIAFDALELVTDPDLLPPGGTTRHADRVGAILSEKIRTRPSREWFGRAMDRGIAMGMLQRPDEVLSCPHLAARGYFDRLRTPWGPAVPFPGEPYHVDGGRTSRERRLARPGEDNRAVYSGLRGQPPEQLADWSDKGAI